MKKFPAKLFSDWLYGWYRNTIRHPKYRWWIILGTLLYLLSPVDIAPDLFPILGWIDDGVIATVLIAEVSQFLSDRRNAQKAESSVSSSNFDTASEVGLIDVDAVSVG